MNNVQIRQWVLDEVQRNLPTFDWVLAEAEEFVEDEIKKGEYWEQLTDEEAGMALKYLKQLKGEK